MISKMFYIIIKNILLFNKDIRLCAQKYHSFKFSDTAQSLDTTDFEPPVSQSSLNFPLCLYIYIFSIYSIFIYFIYLYIFLFL